MLHVLTRAQSESDLRHLTSVYQQAAEVLVCCAGRSLQMPTVSLSFQARLSLRLLQVSRDGHCTLLNFLLCKHCMEVLAS